MNLWLRNFILLALMLAASGTAQVLRPDQMIAGHETTFDLQAVIPHAFDEWHEERQSAVQVINPQQQETIDKIYSQTLSRTYVNSTGDRIMLSIAYGRNQNDSMQLHYPEVCYPAQGFELLSTSRGEIRLAFGAIPVTRLLTSLNKIRMEPVTYWVMIGDQSVPPGRWNKKIAEMHYGLKGLIPDGLLFRISSINVDSNAAFRLQERFVASLIGAVKVEDRKRLFGIGAGPNAAH